MVYRKGDAHGIAAISIDDGAENLIDLCSSTEHHIFVYTSPSALTEGTNTVKLDQPVKRIQHQFVPDETSLNPVSISTNIIYGWAN